MTIYSYDQYLQKMKSSWHDLKIDTLRTQRQLLGTLVFRHRRWAQEKENPQAASLHANVAQLLQQASEQVEAILKLPADR